MTALVAACTSAPKAGQSGSEYLPGDSPGGSTVPCPCGPNDALRVTLLSQGHGNLTLRVEEVLHSKLPLVPGDIIEGQRYDDTFACYRGCAEIAVGEQAFAFYRPSAPGLPACEERDACIADCQAERRNEGSTTLRCACRAEPLSGFATTTGSPSCGLPPVDPGCAAECESKTADLCAPRPEQDFKRGTVNLSPWGETIVFARNARGELSLPRAELGELWRDEGEDHTQNLLRCRERVGDWSKLLENPP